MAYQIKSKIWIESNEGIFLGDGRIQLLKAINSTGSLNKAAKSLNMSYKKAWHLLNSINQQSDEALVITAVGGKNGGGSHLTDHGKEIIKEFEIINQKCWIFLEEQLSQSTLLNNSNQ